MKNNAMARDEYIGIRTSTEVKELLQKVAEKEYRTLSQQCEMILVEWLKKQGHIKEPPKK